MKKSIKIVTTILAIVVVLSVASSAFAVGEKLTHRGDSRTGYVTDNGVPQKTDTNLQCTTVYSDQNYSFIAKPLVGRNPNVSAGLRAPVQEGASCQLSTSNSVRYVYLQILNNPATGSLKRSHATWTLYRGF